MCLSINLIHGMCKPLQLKMLEDRDDDSDRRSLPPDIDPRGPTQGEHGHAACMHAKSRQVHGREKRSTADIKQEFLLETSILSQKQLQILRIYTYIF